VKAAHETKGTEQLRGERFAKYLLVGEIAQGGMGEVFVAVQQGLEGFSKIVVVKRVLRHLTSDSEFTRMFIDEARLAARLEHSNIVKTYEFGEHEGQYYTVMEFLAGEDLGKVLYNLSLRAEMMALPLAIHITSQLCNGLHFAHELTDHAGRPLHLVHRDVNPANLVITYAGEVKIIDFGVAKVDKAAIKTATGILKGKFAYMSPEYIQAQTLDRRADVFSAGIVLWEALTGRQLFARDTTAATMYAVIDDPIPMPSKYRSDVPPQLDAIVARALARDPAHRFATADEMRSALDDLAAVLPKVDARAIGRTMEDLFGTIRAQAMCSIAQSRSLANNISLVMKRPAMLPVSESPVAWLPTIATPTARRRRRRLIIGGAVAGVLGLAGIWALAIRSDTDRQPLAGSAQPAPAAIVAAATPAVATQPASPPLTPPPPTPPPPPTLPSTAPPPSTEPSPAAPPSTAPAVAPPPVVHRPARGTLTVATRANAVVYLDGAVIDRGSFADRTTATGNHKLVVKIPGRRPVTRSISIEANRETRVDIESPQRAVAVRDPAQSTRPPGTSSDSASRLLPGDPPPNHRAEPGAKPPADDPAATVGKLKADGGKPRADVANPDAAAAAQAKPTLDIAATRASVRSQIRPVQQCYERGKMDDANLRGSVTVRITIATNGSVANAQVASSTLGAPEVERCITHEVASWQFPRPAGEAPVAFSYPFTFE
jgi:serine/threonine-protein kinase